MKTGAVQKRSYFKFAFHEMEAQQVGQSFAPLISLIFPLKCKLLIIILKGSAARKDSLWRCLALLARQLNLTVKAAKRRVV